LIDRQAGVSQQCAECPLRDFIVIWDDETTMRRLPLAQDDVASTLTIDLV